MLAERLTGRALLKGAWSMKSCIGLLVVLGSLALLNVGCNTVKGVGKDLTGLAEGTQDAMTKESSAPASTQPAK
jgi:predicted small secreted protein